MRMRFTIGDTEYRLMFEMIDKLTANAHTEESRGVMAYVQERIPDGWKMIANGISRCSIHDKFVKDTGRLLALRKASRRLPTTEMRAAVWHTYNTRRG